MYEPYANMHKILRRPCRTYIQACFSVPLTYTKLTHNLFHVRQRIRQIIHTSAYAGQIVKLGQGPYGWSVQLHNQPLS